MGENKASSLKSGAFQRMAPGDGMQYLTSSPFSKPGKMSSSNLSVGVDSFTSSEDGQPIEMALPFSGNTNAGNFSNDTSDNVDFNLPMHHKTRVAIERLQNKIIKTKEKIKKEQTAKEENVNEYLKLSHEADKQQHQRIKAIFEKKNFKSAQLIGQLQRKLEEYSRSAQRLSTPGSHHKASKGVFKDVGQGLRDFFARDTTRSRDASPSAIGIQSHSRNAATLPGMAKNRDTSVMYKGKYGSADNITSNTHSTPNRDQPLQEAGRSVEYKERSDEDSSGLSDSAGSAGKGALRGPLETSQHYPPYAHHPDLQQQQHQQLQQAQLQQVQQLHQQQQHQQSPHRSLQQQQQQQQEDGGRNSSSGDLEEMRSAVAEFKRSNAKVNNDIEALRAKLEDEGNLFRQALEEEKERCERMEDQINDLTELHQNEVFNLKLELSGIQEKMEYQLEERTRDIHELLLNCQTKVTKMELQQQQQQIISVESIENSNLRGIITKLINVLLAILAVLLVVVSGVANFIAPFLQTRLRMVVSVVVALTTAVLVNRWPLISSYLDTLNPFYHSSHSL